MVHAFQYNGQGTVPGGLIEGIADYIRLKDLLAPPHWQRGRGDKWDAGYDATAYFLDWICDFIGDEWFVQKFNLLMNQNRYKPDVFKGMTGYEVEELWNMYKNDTQEK